jgi:hypothetical protein
MDGEKVKMKPFDKAIKVQAVKNALRLRLFYLNNKICGFAG